MPRCETDTRWIYMFLKTNAEQSRVIRGSLRTVRMQATCWCAVLLLASAADLVSIRPEKPRNSHKCFRSSFSSFLISSASSGIL